MGVEVEVLDSGCCGMAGSWGYEAGHYEVSQACGERALFPKVREAAGDTLVVADGFSCKTQIEQGVGRKALHVAQVLKLARGGDPWEQPSGRRGKGLLVGGAAVGLAAAYAAGVAVSGRWSRLRTSRTPFTRRVFSTSSSIISGLGTSPRR
jgi:hypothetical protein